MTGSHLEVHWPPGLTPDDADLFSHDEILIDAPSATVWRHLVEAPRWPEWSPSSRSVRMLAGPAERLSPSSRFELDAPGVRLEAEVDEFVPDTRLGWVGHGDRMEAYHAWLLVSVAPDECHVVSEEVAKGPGATLVRQDLWLRALKRLSEG